MILQEKMSLLQPEVQKRIQDIQSDNISGAEELARRAVSIFSWLGENEVSRRPSEFLELVVTTAKAVRDAQPNMANLLNIANQFVTAIASLRDIADMKRTILQISGETIPAMDNARDVIGRLASSLIKDGQTVVTHSFSSTVLGALLKARLEGKKFVVVCSESHPQGEGFLLARELGEAQIRVQLVADIRILAFLPKADLILLGADALTVNGLVNKIGSFGIASTAKTLTVSCYTLCSTFKFAPAGYKLQVDKQRDPSENLIETTDNVGALNVYFDVTPLEFLTGVITERGIRTPQQITKELSTVSLHPLLR